MKNIPQHESLKEKIQMALKSNDASKAKRIERYKASQTKFQIFRFGLGPLGTYTHAKILYFFANK